MCWPHQIRHRAQSSGARWQVPFVVRCLDDHDSADREAQCHHPIVITTSVAFWTSVAGPGDGGVARVMGEESECMFRFPSGGSHAWCEVRDAAVELGVGVVERRLIAALYGVGD